MGTVRSIVNRYLNVAESEPQRVAQFLLMEAEPVPIIKAETFMFQRQKKLSETSLSFIQ
jgi:hypothetical protein